MEVCVSHVPNSVTGGIFSEGSNFGDVRLGIVYNRLSGKTYIEDDRLCYNLNRWTQIS
jgi:hypothetical protein